MSGYTPFILLACAMLNASLGHAEVLTEQQAISRALARTAVVDMERQHLLAAESAIGEAGLWPNPVISMDRDQTRAATGNTTETTWKISQTLDLSGKRALLREGAQKRFDAAKAEQGVSRQALTTQVRQVFAEALAGEQTRKAMQAWQDRIAKASATVGRLAKSGEVSGYDKRRLSRELQTAKAKRQHSEASLIRVRHQLAGLTATTDSAALQAVGALLPSSATDLPALIANIPERADLKRLAAQSEAFAREGRAAGRGWAPDVTVGVGQKQVETSAGSEKGLALSFAIPLPLFDRGSPSAARLDAQSRALKAEQSLHLTTAEADITGTWEQLQILQAAAVSFREESLTESQALSGIAERAYRAGETGVLELLDAYRGELDAELTALDLELKARMVRIALDSLAGATP
ncbi:MAG: TolC family protein [Pseudomonadota bacterium]